MSDRDAVLWDVVEEHLDEAEFYAHQRTRALHSAVVTLERLEQWPERQLSAHVDALMVGGEPIVDRVLNPTIEAAEEHSTARLTVTALALLGQNRGPELWNRFRSPLPALRSAIRDATVLSAGPSFDQYVAEQLPRVMASSTRANWLDIAVRRHIRFDATSLLDSDHAETLQAACVLARGQSGYAHMPKLEQLAEYPDFAVRKEAIVAGLCATRPLFRGWIERCFDREDDGSLRALGASLGGTAFHQRLLDEAAREERALYALGFSGNQAALSFFLSVMREPDDVRSRIAGFGFATITGMTLRDARVLPEPEPDDESVVDIDLPPLPNPDAIRSWWRGWMNTMPLDTRLLSGLPWTTAHAVDFIERGEMRRRLPVISWLSVQSASALSIDPRALGHQQRERIERARKRASEFEHDLALR